MAFSRTGIAAAAAGLSLLAVTAPPARGAEPTYYVSPTGNDANDGLTPATAWKSAAKVSGTTFQAGASVLFARGGVWREQLSASSSGAAGAPITYGAYGSGAKPRFLGSDVIAPGSFSPLGGATAGSTWQAGSANPVNSVLADGKFYKRAASLAELNSTPESWLYDGAAKKVYVNSGAVDPTAGTAAFAAAVREDAVLVQGKSHVVIRDLAAGETAKANGGYAFRVQSSAHVTIENSESSRAGKHDFGVINSTGFVGRALHAEYAMPGQGFGGASAFVSFSDATRSADSSTWVDCVAENPNGSYHAFITHGAGVGEVAVVNMTSRGTPGIDVQTDSPDARVTVKGGTFDGVVNLTGDNAVLDGALLTGPRARVRVDGSGNLVQNVIVDGAKVSVLDGSRAALDDRGTGNTFRFNTVRLDPTTTTKGAAVAIARADAGTTLYGNIFDAERSAYALLWNDGSNALDAADAVADFANLFPNEDVQVWLTSASGAGGRFFTFDEWLAAGFGADSVMGDPLFADEQGGNFALLATSPAIDALSADGLAGMPLTDFFSNPRLAGAGYDFGAIESAALPEPGGAVLLFAAWAVMGVTGRRRRPRRVVIRVS